MPLEASQLEGGYEGRPVIRGVDLRLAPGDFAAIVGRNGSGKSTLLKLLCGLLRPTAGAVSLDGQDIRSVSRRELARRLALLPQESDVPRDLTVRELVGFGRYARTGWLRRFGGGDREVVERAIESCELTDLASRAVGSLSGGERQRARIAMALAQEPAVLLLDEPVAALDAAHQLRSLELLDRLHREEGVAVLLILHDVNLAARYCRRLIGVAEGQVVADGSLEEALTPPVLRRITGLDAEIAADPITGRPACFFRRPADGSE